MKIKSLILIAALLCGLQACSPSKEEKGQEMAANYLKGILYHADSYQPLQTRVDSSFISLATDPEAIELTMDMMKLFQAAQEYKEKIDDAESYMEIFTPNNYSSEYEKGEYRRAKEKRDNNQRLFEKSFEHINNQFSKIKNRQSALNEGDFGGWIVYHKYKSLNGAGTVDLHGEYVFLCDTEFHEKAAFSKNDYDQIVKIMSAISTSENISEMFENTLSEIY